MFPYTESIEAVNPASPAGSLCRIEAVYPTSPAASLVQDAFEMWFPQVLAVPGFRD